MSESLKKNYCSKCANRSRDLSRCLWLNRELDKLPANIIKCGGFRNIGYGQTNNPKAISTNLKCSNCGYITFISWRNRKTEPRYCRNCGSKIADPMLEAEEGS